MTQLSNVSKPIYESDYLTCSLVGGGQNVVTFTVSGIKKPADLYNQIRNLSPNVKGMLTLTLRNMSQGWSHRLPLCLR